MTEKKFPPLASKTLEDRLVPIENIKPHPDNYKEHPEDQIISLRASLDAFGWTKPIVVNTQGIIVAGHGMYLTALENGYTHVPVLYVGLDKNQSKAYLAADNETARKAITDTEKLRAILEDVDKNMPDIDNLALGITIEELDFEIAGITDTVDDPASRTESGSGYGEVEEEETEFMSSAKKNEVTGIDVSKYDKYIISYSGGKDSTLLALWCIENLPVEKLVMIYWDSGWNYPEDTQYVRYFANKYKVLTYIFGEVDNKRTVDMIRDMAFPFYGNLWCQSQLKINAIKKMQKYLETLYGKNVIAVNGIRRVESKKRSDYPEFFKDGGGVTWAPMREYTNDDLKDFFKARDERLCPLYQNTNRTACAWCPNFDSMMRGFLQNQHPEILQEINKAIAVGYESRFWKERPDMMIDAFMHYNKPSNNDKIPEYRDIAYTHEEFAELEKLIPSDDESPYIIDVRGRLEELLGIEKPADKQGALQDPEDEEADNEDGEFWEEENAEEQGTDPEIEEEIIY